MNTRFVELDWRPTPIGEISLRRRVEPTLGVDVYEIKLGEQFLMSSLFTEGEVALARLGLEAATGTELDVLVGGLGLGYTARAALDDTRVCSLVVVDALGEVIEWHRRGLLPLGAELTSDDRCRLVRGDFFAMVAGGFGRRFHAALVDIDHSPRDVLDPGHAPFYRPAGLRELARHLHPGGVLALWSNDPPDDEFEAALAEVFAVSRTHVVTFHNHLQDRDAANTVYVARRRLDH